MSTEVTLQDLKATVDNIQQTLQVHLSRQEDDSLLIHSVASKLDVQGQRLRSIESEVKHMKEVFTKDTSKSRNINADGDKAKEGLHIQQSDLLSEQSICSLKEELKECMRVDTEKVQSFVREEIKHMNDLHKQQVDTVKDEMKESMRVNTEKLQKFVSDEIKHHSNNLREEMKESSRANTEVFKASVREQMRQTNDLYTQHATDISSRLDKTEQLVYTPLSEMASSMSSINNVQKDIRNIVNSLDEHTQTLSDIKENIIPKAEHKILLQTLLKVVLKSVGKTSEQESNLVNQAELKVDMNRKLDTLTDTTREQTSAIKKIQDEFGPEGKLNKTVRKYSQTLLDQIVCESQIIHEIIKDKRTERKIHECDFFVTDISKLIRSGERQYSQLWFIDGAKKYLKGSVVFKPDGTLDIWIRRGFNPRVVGLQIKNGPGVSVTVKAMKLGQKHWELSTKNISTNELNDKPHCDGWTLSSGYAVASISCQELKDKGYVDSFDRIILRYEITVL